MKHSVIALATLLTPLLAHAEVALTIYNQNFAVVRDLVPLELQAGTTEIRYYNATSQLEPDSVILRDPAGKVPLTILEQNYRNDPVTQETLLSLHEGETIEFKRTLPQTGEEQILRGKIIRSSPGAIIEVNGKIQFSLPGEPIFPALHSDQILKPTLYWKIASDKAGPLHAELAYITGGLTWEAEYNVIAKEGSETLDFIGWITMSNQSGKTFEEARIKLMAGDVSKITPHLPHMEMKLSARGALAASAPTVTEKSFDEYHLYTLSRPTTLRDKETKQVEFINTSGVKSERLYIYDGATIPEHYRHQNPMYLLRDENFGIESHNKVAIVREFKNTKANGLGIPLPKGRVRFYQQDSDHRLEFLGENVIDHTPADETLRIYTGNAFDLVGERTRTNFTIDSSKKTVVETFEIKLRNRKKDPVHILVVEKLYRWFTWEITESSLPFLKKNSKTVEFNVPVAPGEEKVLTYTVKYTW